MELKQKVTLKTKGESAQLLSKEIKLAQKGDNEFLINLNWNTTPPEAQKKKPQGFFGKVAAFLTETGPVDLDLGCFLQFRNGDWDGYKKWCIDGLQFANQPDSYKGSLTSAPWVRHTGDDRSGAVAAGESIKVNVDQCHNLYRLNIYVFIYEGATAWNKTDAVVTVKVPGQTPIEVPLGDADHSERFCVVATLDFSPQGDITVTRNMTWHHGGHSEMDQAYGWGMQWQAGSK